MTRVLIVDDEIDTLNLLRTILDLSGYQAFTTLNSVDAITLAELEQPDCILLDIMMPQLDGFTLCKMMRLHPSTAHLPIVFVTAYSALDLEERRKEAGADMVLPKPIGMDTLIEAVEKAISMRLATANGKSESVTVTTITPPFSTLVTGPRQPEHAQSAPAASTMPLAPVQPSMPAPTPIVPAASTPPFAVIGPQTPPPVAPVVAPPAASQPVPATPASTTPPTPAPPIITPQPIPVASPGQPSMPAAVASPVTPSVAPAATTPAVTTAAPSKPASPSAVTPSPTDPLPPKLDEPAAEKGTHKS